MTHPFPDGLFQSDRRDCLHARGHCGWRVTGWGRNYYVNAVKADITARQR
jgi:hypothetical protein